MIGIRAGVERSPHEQAAVAMHAQQEVTDLREMMLGLMANEAAFNQSKERWNLVAMILDWQRRGDWAGIAKHMWRAHVLNWKLWTQRENLKMTRKNVEDLLDSQKKHLQAKIADRERRLRRTFSKNAEIPIDQLELSVRTRNCLQGSLQAETIADVLGYSRQELLRMPNFGRKSLNELIEVFGMYGIEIYDEVKEEPEPIKYLPERHALVMRDLADGCARKDVAKKYQVTATRIAQLRDKSIRRLLHGFRFPNTVKLKAKHAAAIEAMLAESQ